MFEDVSSIIVKNSFFKNSSSSHGFEISDGSSTVTLDNVFIHNSGYYGSSAYGLYISDSSGVTIKNNTKVGDSKTYELYANGVSASAVFDGLKVQNSTFIGSNLALIEDSDGFLIEKSTFKDSSNGDYGVYIKNTDSGTFIDNTILNSASDDGSDYGALYLTGSKTNLLQNNTITNSGRSGFILNRVLQTTKYIQTQSHRVSFQDYMYNHQTELSFEIIHFQVREIMELRFQVRTGLSLIITL